MADDLVLEALRMAIGQDGDTLLVKSGKQAGLFKSRAGKANQQAMDACLKADPPLLEVTREEKGSGKAKTVKPFVRITDAGIAALVDRTPPAEYPALLAQVAPSHQQTVLMGCLRGSRAIDAEIERTLQTARTVHEAILARAQASLETLNRRVAEFQAQRQAIHEAIERLGPPPRIEPAQPRPPVADETEPEPRPIGPRPEPKSEDDLDYQRAISQQLAVAWRDFSSEEARAGLEQALVNAGVEPIGTPGEIVPFNGMIHTVNGDVTAGQEVEVVEPGWQLENPRGVFTLLRARVRVPAISPP